MFRAFAKRGRLEAIVHELKANMAAAPMKFSTEVLDEYQRMNLELGLEDGEPRFERIAMTDNSQSPYSHISQMVLALEGLCFYTHYLNRLSFRPGDERLREAVYDPVVRALAQLFSDMIGALPSADSDPPSAEYILSYINSREAQYAECKQFFGESPEDAESVVGIAPRTIADVNHRPKNVALRNVILVALLRQIELTDWRGMIETAARNV